MNSPVSRRRFMHIGAGAGIAAAGSQLFPAVTHARSHQADKPNIILIMADDLGYEGVRANGGSSYQTPAIDSLINGGINFTSCYATPTCTPSRVEIMSGTYPHHNGMNGGIWERGNDKQFVDWTQVGSFGTMLKSAGYSTAVAGKWQLCRFDLDPDNATKAGFDEHCLWTWSYDDPDNQISGWSRFQKPDIWENGSYADKYFSNQHYGPDVYCDFLLDFMERKKNDPFFVYFPMALVHRPEHNPPGYSNAEGTKIQNMVNYMDVLVGRIKSKVDELGLAQNTLILFTGDNGFASGITSALDSLQIAGEKHNMTYIGCRVPMIAHWPGTTPAGVTCNDHISLADVLPTLHELGGGSLPQDMKVDGRSFARQIVTGSNPDFPDWCYQGIKNKRMVRHKDYTLYKDGSFYNVKKDYFEDHNIAPGTGTSADEAARTYMQNIMDTIEDYYRPLPENTSALAPRNRNADLKHAFRVTTEKNAVTVSVSHASHVWITDLKGRSLTPRVFLRQGTTRTIGTSHLAGGTYLISTCTARGTITRRLVL